ncbi:MAG: hypothetical protein ABIS50_10925 [Luteolibacter sp.]|uniref:hypothetical protein n=1 Tax=Luteolibacter sp. TaxID=1962973 RepID=UPI003266A536
MNEEPEIPQPPSAIPRWPLWLTLGIPPLMTLLANFMVPFCGIAPDDAAGFLALSPLFMVFGVIPGLGFHFHDAVRHRYRGWSLGFLVSAYFIGEIIVCLVLSVGSCFLVSSHLNSL